MPTSKRGGRRANPGGRPPKPLTERAAFKGKIAVRISSEVAMLLQSLMLYDTPNVQNPDQMVEWLIRQEVARRGGE